MKFSSARWRCERCSRATPCALNFCALLAFCPARQLAERLYMREFMRWYGKSRPGYSEHVRDYLRHRRRMLFMQLDPYYVPQCGPYVTHIRKYRAHLRQAARPPRKWLPTPEERDRENAKDRLARLGSGAAEARRRRRERYAFERSIINALRELGILKGYEFQIDLPAAPHEDAR